MRVLVACEYSGIVRDAFAAKGHEAWSCDILDSEAPGLHYKGNVLDIIGEGWDILIGFPPCTYLSYAGIAHWHKEGRKELRDEALELFKSLYAAPADKICIENPVGYANTVFRKPTQIIEPFYFGDNERKRTCLWLKNLPKLNGLVEVALDVKKYEPAASYVHLRRKTGIEKKRYFVDAMKGSKKDLAHRRSKTFPGIAKAMAEQWG